MQRGGLSLVTILIGVTLGIGAGLFYTWKLNPVVQTNTAPWQLTQAGQQAYLIVISLAYSKDHDVIRAADRLRALDLHEKTWQTVADAACDLARTSYSSTTTGLVTIRSMVELAQSQGATGCASELVPLYTSTPAPTVTVVRPTATLIPPATKTQVPTLGPTFTPEIQDTPNLTPTSMGDFRLAIETFCDPKNPGMILVFVQETDGGGIPGVPILVTSSTDTDTFFTGLKPERDPGYADFQMTADETYTVALPGLSERSRPLQASSCNVAASDGGGKSQTSYRVVFRELAR